MLAEHKSGKKKSERDALRNQDVKAAQGKVDIYNICIRCQECCRWMTFNLFKPSNEMLDYYDKHGCRLISMGESVLVMVPSTCQHLGHSGCAIYPARPEFCRGYDGRNDPLMRDACQLPKGEKQ